MNVTKTLYAEADIVIREGWKVLVKKLGIQRATQFIILVERGKGDSVKEIADYWGKANIEEIYDQVSAWKAKKHSSIHPIESLAGV